MNFKLWLENDDKELLIKLKAAFDSVKSALVGHSDDEWNKSLNHITDGSMQGYRAVRKVITPILNVLKSYEDPNVQTRLNDVETFLHSMQTGNKPNLHTVGRLLHTMFGDELYSKFSGGQPIPAKDVTEPAPEQAPDTISQTGRAEEVPMPGSEPDLQEPLQPPNKRQIGQEFSSTLDQ